jgi:hypothetical protein
MACYKRLRLNVFLPPIQIEAVDPDNRDRMRLLGQEGRFSGFRDAILTVSPPSARGESKQTELARMETPWDKCSAAVSLEMREMRDRKM